MSNVHKNKKLSATQLEALPITINEANKLLGPVTKNLSDDYIARRILYLSEIARILTKTLDLHK